MILFEEIIRSVEWEKEKPNVLKILFTERVDLEQFFFSALFELVGLPGQKTFHSGVLQSLISSGQTLAEIENVLTMPPLPKHLTLQLSKPLGKDCHSIKFYSRVKKDRIVYATFPILKN